MEVTNKVPAGPRVLLSMACFVIVVAGMKAASPILVPFLLSVFIALIFSPLLFWMQRKGIQDGIAILVILALIVVIGWMLTALVGNSVNDFLSQKERFTIVMQDRLTRVTDWLEEHDLQKFFDEKFGEDDATEAFPDSPQPGLPESQDTPLATPPATVPPGPEDTDTESQSQWIVDLTEQMNPGKVFDLAGKTFQGLRRALTNIFLILLTVVFILLEAAGFPRKLEAALDRPDDSLKGYSQFTESLKRYLVVKSIFSAITGVVIWIWLSILGVEFAMLWGLLAFLLNFVPNIGSILAAIPAVLMALVQFGPGKAIAAALGFLVVNVVVGSITEPRFMGRELGLSTLVVFLSLVFWGWVLGPVGMLLSVPLTMVLKIALGSSEDTRWISTMLGPDPGRKRSSDPDKESAAVERGPP
jgi:predicted PurR-regulated permease PerM